MGRGGVFESTITWVVGGLLLIALLALLARRFGRGAGGDFSIRLGPEDRVEVLGKIPKAKVPAIRAFFREQPGGVPRGRIIGKFGPGGTPRLSFIGAFDPGLRQRTRNFLIEHLH